MAAGQFRESILTIGLHNPFLTIGRSTMSEITAPEQALFSSQEPDPRRWSILAVVVIAQLMVVLDASIVTIALPSAQRSLHISVANRQWVITAYTLAFGGLLLLGGRIADYGGRKRMFMVGLMGFAGASALGGLANDQAMLFAARALQGGMAALMAPAALSILTITFQSDPSERAKAFGAYGAVSGAGGAIGVLAGGILTEYASWRWCLLVNVPSPSRPRLRPPGWCMRAAPVAPPATTCQGRCCRLPAWSAWCTALPRRSPTAGDPGPPSPSFRSRWCCWLRS